MGKKIDGQNSSPENLLMGKVPDGYYSDGHSTWWALFLVGILPYTPTIGGFYFGGVVSWERNGNDWRLYRMYILDVQLLGEECWYALMLPIVQIHLIIKIIIFQVK